MKEIWKLKVEIRWVAAQHDSLMKEPAEATDLLHRLAQHKESFIVAIPDLVARKQSVRTAAPSVRAIDWGDSQSSLDCAESCRINQTVSDSQLPRNMSGKSTFASAPHPSTDAV
jgi:hypothetical protein